MWRLAAFAVYAFAWQLFSNGPLAFYVIAGVTTAWLCIELAIKSERKLWPVFGLGAAMAFLTSGCGALFVANTDGFRFMCDQGSGLPVSIISGLCFVGVLVYVAGSKK
jgi:hypothetical protein